MASAGTEVGTAVVKLKFDGSGVDDGLKTAENKTSNFGSKIKSVASGIGKALSGAFAVGAAAAVAFVKNATKSFAEYEQLVGGVDTLFGDASNQIQKYAAEAFQTAQISANDYMSTVTSFSASLIQSLGGDTRKAAEYANNAIIDMSDNANKMGTDISMIQNAYSGFARQNYTMLDNLKLGYAGTKEEMQRLLEDAEKLSGIHYELGNFADMTAAIHVVQENLGIAGTSAKEASATVSGSLAAMGAAWKNLVTGVGNANADMSGLIQNFISAAGTALKNLIPVILSSLENIAQLIVEIVPMITAQLPTLIRTLIPPLVNVLVQIAVALVQNLPLIITTVLEAFLSSLPVIIESIVGALPDIINAIVEFLTNPDTIMMIIEAAVKLFFGLVEAVPKILSALISSFGKLISNLWEGIKRFFGEFAGKFGEFISGIFKGAINGVLSFIENFINAPIKLINGFIGLINDAFGWLGVNIGKIGLISLPRLAQGGVVDSATPVVIGEAGKEAVIPLENNTDNWTGLLASALSEKMEETGEGTGKVVVYMTNEINNKLDIKEVSRELMQEIRRAA